MDTAQENMFRCSHCDGETAQNSQKEGGHRTKSEYQVSKKKRPTLVLLISQLSRGLEIPTWTFFNSPFRVEILSKY